MSRVLLGAVMISMVFAFAMAVWAYTAGLGLIIAFLIYAFGGAASVLGLCLAAYSRGGPSASPELVYA